METGSSLFTTSGRGVVTTPHRSPRLARQPRGPQVRVLEMGSSSVGDGCSIVPMHPVDAPIHLSSAEPITGGDTQNPTGTSVEHADNTLVTIGHLVPDVTTDSTETPEADSAPPGTPCESHPENVLARNPHCSLTAWNISFED